MWRRRARFVGLSTLLLQRGHRRRAILQFTMRFILIVLIILLFQLFFLVTIIRV